MDSKQPSGGLMISGLETDVPPAQRLRHARPFMMTAQIKSSGCGQICQDDKVTASEFRASHVADYPKILNKSNLAVYEW